MVKQFKHFIVLGIFFLCGCAPGVDPNLKEYNETKKYFGAYVTIRFFYDSKREISSVVEKCWEKINLIQQEMNADSVTGDLARINKSGFKGVEVHQETYRLIKDSLELSRLSRGAFDVTVFPLVELWRDAAAKGRLPDKESLDAVKGKVGYQNIRLKEPNLVFLAKQGMKIDLGAIASGFACDEIAAILDASGIRHFLIDTAGEIFCRGREAGRTPWRIGVQDPVDKDKVLLAIELSDRCVSTSGNYEKFTIIEGARYSHIIDPVSGYPQQGVISATVIAGTGKEADALSTALSVLGGKKGIDLIKSLKDVQAMIMESENGRTVTYATEDFR
jgi:thiamine biosynthesis lipoprotein